MGVSFNKSRDYLHYVILLRDPLHASRREWLLHRRRFVVFLLLVLIFVFFSYDSAHIETVLETLEELLEPQSVSVIDRLSP
jgi:hypothetical protein